MLIVVVEYGLPCSRRTSTTKLDNQKLSCSTFEVKILGRFPVVFFVPLHVRKNWSTALTAVIARDSRLQIG